MQKLLLLIFSFLLISCEVNKPIKKELMSKSFGVNCKETNDHREIKEEKNVNFYDISNYKIFDDKENFNIFISHYNLTSVEELAFYDEDYFNSNNALLLYYNGSPTYVDGLFEIIEYEKYDKEVVKFYYHSVKGEYIPTISIYKFNFMIIDLPNDVKNITLEFIDLTK